MLASSLAPLPIAPMPDSLPPDALTVTLPDGTVVLTRAIRPSDAPALQRFHARLSERSIYMRFFQVLPTLQAERAAHFTELDGVDRYARVALDPADPDEIVGVVRYDREPDTDRAEYAIVIADPWQGHGLGLALTRQLVAVACAHGIRHFYAYVLPENRRMLNLFHDLAVAMQGCMEDGVRRIDLDLIHEAPPEG